MEARPAASAGLAALPASLLSRIAVLLSVPCRLALASACRAFWAAAASGANTCPACCSTLKELRLVHDGVLSAGAWLVQIRALRTLWIEAAALVLEREAAFCPALTALQLAAPSSNGSHSSCSLRCDGLPAHLRELALLGHQHPVDLSRVLPAVACLTGLELGSHCSVSGLPAAQLAGSLRWLVLNGSGPFCFTDPPLDLGALVQLTELDLGQTWADNCDYVAGLDLAAGLPRLRSLARLNLCLDCWDAAAAQHAPRYTALAACTALRALDLGLQTTPALLNCCFCSSLAALTSLALWRARAALGAAGGSGSTGCALVLPRLPRLRWLSLTRFDIDAEQLEAALPGMTRLVLEECSLI
eukprot:scaffold6.g2818.t1